MNLTCDPWIPAVRSDGLRDLFSLEDLFAQAHTLQDLAVKPHERIAVMRLLICITQAALDGPKDEDAWENCRSLIQPRVKDYLSRWRAKFELYGNGERFLQVANLVSGKSDDEATPATKLDLALATNNNPTLFDTEAGQQRAIDAPRTALNLLTFQCFSPGGTIGVAEWKGKGTPGGRYSKHAPCVPSSMIHALRIGDALLTTIHLNLLTTETMQDVPPCRIGRPVWERFPDDADAASEIENATHSHLGRLVPLTRAVRLYENGRSVVLANGLEFPPFPASREPTATIVKMGKDELGMLSASTDRALWRQLAPITIRRLSSKDLISGPLAIAHDASGSEVALWVGAFVTDKTNAAKIEDVIEGFYKVPHSMFDAFGRAAFECGVRYADLTESALIQAVKQFAATLKVDKPAYERARQHFWTRVEQSLPALFAIARELTPEIELPGSVWGRAVQASALDAYQQVCPSKTPRQIHAHAMGLGRLSRTAVSKSAKPKKATSHE